MKDKKKGGRGRRLLEKERNGNCCPQHANGTTSFASKTSSLPPYDATQYKRKKNKTQYTPKRVNCVSITDTHLVRTYFLGLPFAWIHQSDPESLGSSYLGSSYRSSYLDSSYLDSSYLDSSYLGSSYLE